MGGLERILADFRDRLPMFVMYDHPKDYPDYFVARLHVSLPEPRPLAFAIMCDEPQPLRELLERTGLVRFLRDVKDDPTIMEVWL